MHFTFHPSTAMFPACSCEQTGTHFTFSVDLSYRNRSYRFREDAFLFDGYSHYFRGPANFFTDTDSFTVSVAFMPITFSAHADGLFTCYDAIEKKGIELYLERGGVVTVNLGHTIFSGLRARAQAGVWNVATVIYRGYAGWCDLYLNGIFAGRRQFPRHTLLTFPQNAPYIGKRMDNVHFREALPFGTFYGYMRWVDIDQTALSETEVLSLHQTVYTGERDEAAFAAAMPLRSDYALDPNRPTYHLCPPGKWMNEPHGPMFYNGFYHIFYQANPHAPIWDHLSWGHLKSRDMLHWEDCPLALIPEKEANSQHGCWSGSSVIDKDGLPRIYFTAGDDTRFPNQAIALAQPDDPSDPSLTYWHTRGELIQEQDIGWMGEFRDPFVWLEGDTYFMLVGSGDPENGGGNAILYSSDDGMAWQSHGFLMDYDYSQNTELGHVWELPVMLPLRDESGEIFCHIVLLCACQIEGDIVETYYFLGDWDPVACRFTPSHEKAGLIDLSKGCFTGPSGLVTPDGRSVVFTIAQGKRRFMDEVRDGWAHNGGMPVELSIRGGRLQILPIRELAALRGEMLPLDHTGNTLCLDYTAVGDAASVLLYYGSEDHYEIFYDRLTRHLGIQNTAGEDISRYRGPVDDVDIDDEDIHFLCYLDHSMLEIYLNGRKAVTLRNYTDGARHFEVRGEGKELTLWQI